MNSITNRKLAAASHRRPMDKALWRAAAGLGALLFTGCRCAPSINLLGSFFPAWMLCAAVGAAGTFVSRQVCVKTNIEPYLRPRVLVYFCLWVLITLSSWLLFFRN